MIEEKKSKIWTVLRAILVVLAILFCVALSVLMLQFVSETEKVEALMKAHPYIGPLIYIGITMLQVIIVLIPGEPVEIAGGYVFGAVQGTILYLIGATLGSLLVFCVVRKFGSELLELFFSKENIKSLRFLQNSKKRNVLLSIIFIIPGTPKDLLCYFAGLTDIKFKVWFWVCSLGRLPSIVTSMLGGDALETKSYVNAIIVFAITLFVSGIGLLVYKIICGQHEKLQKDTKSELEKEEQA
ncbi:MAG: TVP38/TMEM64 family protein [Lachnospiraceae bacterium]|nr:TVP38/TMEM64 family protein [Lachnospiraceae bacterium]